LPHVELVTDRIARITPTGIVTADGQEREFDVIACATGFDTSYAPRYDVVGRDASTTLAAKWQEGPRSYLGLAEAGFRAFAAFPAAEKTK
jgi:cation diffusion facilitator CzcD-associated flavoprotein CzcO